MEIVFLNNENFKEWNSFVDETSSCWLDHRYENILNDIETRFAINRSFMVKSEGKIVAVMPIVIRMIKSRLSSFNEIIGSGVSGPAFSDNLNYSQREKVEKFIFESLDGIAKKESCVRCSFKVNPLVSVEKVGIPINYMKYGFANLIIPARVLDLTISIDELWKRVRKQTRSLISQSINDLKFEEFSYSDLNVGRVKEIYDLQTIIARESNYSIFSIELLKRQFELMLKTRLSRLFVLKLNGKIVACTLIKVYKEKAYYASGSSVPEFKLKLNVNHVLQWQVISLLKTEGIKFYNLGWQFYPQLNVFPTSKEEDISFFKRSFGGFDVPMWGGEKYYSKQFYLMIALKRVYQYLEYIK